MQRKKHGRDVVALSLQGRLRPSNLYPKQVAVELLRVAAHQPDSIA
jgi:hypothetical protein